MEIIYTKKEKAPLYCLYAGQCREQDAYVELNCDAETLCADWDGEIGGGIPCNVWHNRCLRFTCSPYLHWQSINELLDQIKPLAERVIAGYDTDWDGNNWVGTYNEDAKKAKKEIAALCEETLYGEYSVWVYTDPDDYFVDGSIFAEWKAGETMEQAAERILAETEAKEEDNMEILINFGPEAIERSLEFWLEKAVDNGEQLTPEQRAEAIEQGFIDEDED